MLPHPSSSLAISSLLFNPAVAQEKPMSLRVGIIGLDTSHAVAFTSS